MKMGFKNVTREALRKSRDKGGFEKVYFLAFLFEAFCDTDFNLDNIHLFSFILKGQKEVD